jgi:DNA-binding NarL/FixJ family response regulator
MFILADNQDITRLGLMYVIERTSASSVEYVGNKEQLIKALQQAPESVVICDYTQFDFSGPEDLQIIVDRFARSNWLLFSEELSTDFVRMITASSSRVGVLLKTCLQEEIEQALDFALRGKRYICQEMTELLISSVPETAEPVKLTKTEKEILRDIALGMTTKEIAERRFSSFHTVNTHRKNIFRKLGVNNVHEATKYAFKAGLVDAAEYYI